MTEDEKRQQVADQCKVVATLATAIAEVHSDLERMFREGAASHILDHVGMRTAYMMEVFGNILNGMDAAEEEDEWMEPIFERAQQLWPHEDPGPITKAED